MKIGDVDLHHRDGPHILTDEGWVRADGRLVSRKRNPRLYELIGTAYCDEDARCCNSELFNLPDYSKV